MWLLLSYIVLVQTMDNTVQTNMLIKLPFLLHYHIFKIIPTTSRHTAPVYHNAIRTLKVLGAKIFNVFTLTVEAPHSTENIVLH